MAENKTRQNDNSVQDFLESVPDQRKREDAFILLDLMQEASGEEPKMWGDSIVGFGKYHYKYASGREGDMPLVGFSPRRQNLALYITSDFDRYRDLLNRLGKHKTGKACLYINRLEQVNIEVLREMVRRSVEDMRKTDPG